MSVVGRIGHKRRPALLLTTSLIGGGLLSCATAHAQTGAGAAAPATLGEIVVTASRRSESISKLPFNISAYSAEQIERSNITSVTALSQQVPNFVIQDQGARDVASSIPIIRGLNASQPSNDSARYFQPPVGFYLGNAPITGYLPIEDIQRIEVLRGPQGTLYGAGALAGAVRTVPTDPKLGKFEGEVTGSASTLAHSSQTGYDFGGIVNIPISENAALRIGGKRYYEAGFIDQHDIMARSGGYAAGTPVLANPADVANSPAVYFNKKDSNSDTTTAVRATLLWRPTSDFSLELGYSTADIAGNGAPRENGTYPGGASPIDPRIILAPAGKYEHSSPTLEPFSRRSRLATLDASYDLGFATVSTTIAYGVTHGYAVTDATVNLLGSPYGFYYTGTPANPRTVIPVTFEDDEDNYTEEVRIVSKRGEHFDYVAGAFFEQNHRHIGEEVWTPGADVQSAAAHGGSTLPIVEGGTYIPLFPGNASYYQETQQKFKDYSLYGDLTWHATERLSVTGGLRVFHQNFDQRLFQASSFFGFNNNFDNPTSLTKAIYKANTSYRLNEHSQVYATWSQGFRRGGANAFPTTGPVLEPTDLLTYKPDKTNNFEIGIKGTAHEIYYNLDVFYVAWSNPQIDLQTPFNLTSAVVNGGSAASKGVEFEASGPIGPKGLSFNLGFAYSPARLTQSFGLPAGSGLGTVIPDAIVGKKGDRLPGAPDFSASANLNYTVDLGEKAKTTFTIGADYRGSTVNELPNINPETPAFTAPAYALLRGSIELDLNDWQVTLFGTNLADKHAVISKNVRTQFSQETLGTWGDSYVVVRPREIGLRVTRHF